MTPDAQDLKEEVRANLVARTAELEAAGRRRRMPRARRSPSSAMCATCSTAPTMQAARRQGLVRRDAAPPPRAPEARLRRARRRVVARSSSSAITLAILGATGVLPLPIGPIIGLMGMASTGLGAGGRRLALAGDDDQPPDAAEPRRRVLPRHASRDATDSASPGWSRWGSCRSGASSSRRSA